MGAGLAGWEDAAGGPEREGVGTSGSRRAASSGRPTLFIVFINPIDLVLENLSGFLSKFADDTKVGHIADTNENRETLQAILNYLTDWADNWQMAFN